MYSRYLGLLTLLAALSAATSFSIPPAQKLARFASNERPSTVLKAEAGSEVKAPAPVLDGKRVLPLKIMKAGLKGHKVAAVYALLNADYKKG